MRTPDEAGVSGLDHVQVAMPRGEEERARAFYGSVLGMVELPKPPMLAQRGGVWFACGGQMLHLGVEDAFTPQRKAHPALLVRDLAALRARLTVAGYEVFDDEALPGYERYYTADPFGNRLEFLWPVAVSLAAPGTTRGTDAGADAEAGEAIKARVRATFGENAAAYVASTSHATGDDLRRLVELAAPIPADRALDLSTGGGHAALALAPRVGRLTATDLTPRMLALAREHLRGRGIVNVDFVVADAEQLPFLDASFTLASVRIAPHHYANPQRAMDEVARVLAPGGRFVLIDNIAPENALLDRLGNDWERRRDPSHVRNYTLRDWQRMLAAAGLRITTLETGRKSHDYADWVARTRMDAAAAAAMAAEMLAAPTAARDYFALVEQEGRLVSWSGEYFILRAER